MKKLVKFIRNLFFPHSKTKEPIMIGGEKFIVLLEMWICRINDVSAYSEDLCKIFLGPRLYDSVACKIAKLIEGGSSDLDYVPEGYGLEMLPDIYLLTISFMETKILPYPMVLRKLNGDEYEAIGLSKIRERRLRDWWDIRNALPTPALGPFSLKKFLPKTLL